MLEPDEPQSGKMLGIVIIGAVVFWLCLGIYLGWPWMFPLG